MLALALRPSSAAARIAAARTRATALRWRLERRIATRPGSPRSSRSGQGYVLSAKAPPLFAVELPRPGEPLSCLNGGAAFNHVAPGNDPQRYRAASSLGAASAPRYSAASSFGAREPRRDYRAASSFGATSFLRLITPGNSISLSCACRPNARADARDVARHEQVGSLGQYVGDHQRVELEPPVLASGAHRLEQLVLAIEQRLADDLDLGDADRVPAAGVVLLGIARDDLVGADLGHVGGRLEHLATEVGRVEREHTLEVLDDLAVALGRGRRS